MSEDEDVDLLSLQRQLDDAFETTRPRHDFEDELWLRLQSRRPFRRRMQDGLAGLINGVRDVPAVPAAAVAVVLVLLVGGVLTLGGLHFGGGAGGTATTGAGRSPGVPISRRLDGVWRRQLSDAYPPPR